VRHLKDEEFLDIAEGTRPESSAPHLDGCDSCRAQLHDLRAMMSAAQEVDVPEPSPLFWDHLSSRVNEAVAAEGVPRGFDASAWRRLLMPLSAVAVAGLLIAVAVTPAPPGMTVADAAPAIELLRDISSDEDVSLTLVASLTDRVDLDTVREAGLATRGSAEDAITHMSESELRELGRLLQEELARPGA
jgi:hypothetical protein